MRTLVEYYFIIAFLLIGIYWGSSENLTMNRIYKSLLWPVTAYVEILGEQPC